MTFDMQPRLEGERLSLRPLTAQDFSALHAAAADPLIWEQHPVKDRWREPVFTIFFEDALASRSTLVAIDRSLGPVIGSSRFHGYDAERSEVEIGWTFLTRSYWGGAWNGEMKALMLNHAFRFVDSVVFLIAPDNIRSQRAVEKIGAVRDGRRRDAAGRDSLLFRLSRGRWNAAAPAAASPG